MWCSMATTVHLCFSGMVYWVYKDTKRMEGHKKRRSWKREWGNIKKGGKILQKGRRNDWAREEEDA